MVALYNEANIGVIYYQLARYFQPCGKCLFQWRAWEEGDRKYVSISDNGPGARPATGEPPVGTSIGGHPAQTPIGSGPAQTPGGAAGLEIVISFPRKGLPAPDRL